MPNSRHQDVNCHASRSSMRASWRLQTPGCSGAQPAHRQMGLAEGVVGRKLDQHFPACPAAYWGLAWLFTPLFCVRASAARRSAGIMLVRPATDLMPLDRDQGRGSDDRDQHG